MRDINTQRDLAHAAKLLVLPWVQVRVDTVTTCARLIDRFQTREKVDFVKLELVQPWKGTAFYPAFRIKACSGFDGHCMCAGEVGSQVVAAGEGVNACAVGASLRRASAAGVCEVPHGNHGDHNFSASTASC